MENNSKNNKSERARSRFSHVNRLATLLGISSFDGAIGVAALSGLFKVENSFMIAVLFMAGPGAILTAMLFDGTMKERMIAALFAGLIATIIVVLAAGVGAKALSFLNMEVLRIFGGISIFLISLLIFGVKISDKLPMAIIILGLVIAVLWRN